MSYELAVSEGSMTAEQLQLGEKYSLQNYVKWLTIDHRNTRDEILRLERATRGQTENILWKLLRVNRTTASRSSAYVYDGQPTKAMEYGVLNEKLLKQDRLLINAVRDGIENRLGIKVVNEVLDCGLFISEIGLFSASPDAYFELDTGALVVMEIKCPYTYRNETLETVRLRMNNNRNRYRVPHTAFSISRRDALNVLVEKRNDHYRQIQTQLYVTGAVLAVYVVKFSDKPEVHFVTRDDAFIDCLRKREKSKLWSYVKENGRNRVMVMEKERFNSFGGFAVHEEKARLLASDGMYHWCGNVVCYFCKRHFEITDKTVEQIREEHGSDCDKSGNISMVEVAHAKYLNVLVRLENLRCAQLYDEAECEKLAKEGFFYDGTNLVLYCCGGKASHEAYCKKSDTQ